MTPALVVFVCPTCGHATTTLRNAIVTCNHPNTPYRLRPPAIAQPAALKEQQT